jgi:uncharacterized membrane protein
MFEGINHLFAAICGQNPEHTWAPGGILLPCCQRCTGLYAGACVAALLHLWLRPKLTARFLEAHGLFLLLMAPFGFHWLPQGPVLRVITGVIFGFAVVTFLWLPLGGKAGHRVLRASGWSPLGSVGQAGCAARLRNRTCIYGVALLVTLAGLPLAAIYGDKGAAFGVSGMVFAGAMLLGALALGSVVVCLTGVFRLVRLLAFHRTRA